MTPDAIARVAHEANRAYQMATLDPAVSPPWDAAPGWQRRSAIVGVQHALDGATPEQLHESWMAEKTAGGWVYGPVKNFKTRTHPCMVPYAELPREQRVKDDLFHAVVNALTSATEWDERKANERLEVIKALGELRERIALTIPDQCEGASQSEINQAVLKVPLFDEP